MQEKTDHTGLGCVPKVALLIVYFMPDDSTEWIFHEQLRMLDKLSYPNFCLYACVKRLPAGHRQILSRKPYAILPELEENTFSGSEEHGDYLDQMTRIARADGADYIATLDMDSWPIVPDLFEQTLSMLEDREARLAAVFRAENGDSYLPHPCYLLAEANLFEYPTSLFCPDRRLYDSARMAQFLDNTGQAVDTGLGLAMTLWEHHLDWIRLLRTNKTDHHYILGGVYADLIFHLGGSTRSILVMRGDGMTWARTLTAFMPFLPFVWKYRSRVFHFLERIWEPGASRRNRKLLFTMRDEIQRDGDEFYRSLQ